MCVLTNERYKTYQTGFSFCRLSHAPGWDFGALGVPSGAFFFKHDHVANQINKDNEQNRIQLKFSSYDQTGDLGVWSKGQISLNLWLHCQIFYTRLCVRSYKLKIENILNIISILLLRPCFRICDCTPATAHSSYCFNGICLIPSPNSSIISDSFLGLNQH